MAARFQACTLVSPPMFPNAIAWSEENLIAVATGHIVTILNPALPCGPRGLIMLPAPKPFQIGVIERKDPYNASDSSFGIAISPGNMVLANVWSWMFTCAVHSPTHRMHSSPPIHMCQSLSTPFDNSLLDPIYQARCLKGAVEFFSIGGQEVELSPDTRLEINLDESPEFSEKELLHWLLASSLKHFEDSKKSLFIWDVVAALLAFKIC